MFEDIYVSLYDFSEDIEKKYGGKLTQEMSGPDYEVVSKIFKAITTRKITVPGGFVG